MGLSSVRAVPSIMRNKGWNVAAFLLETWFSRASYVRSDNITEGERRNAVDFSGVGGLTWIRKFKAGQETYDKIFNNSLWRTYDDGNGNAQKKLVKILKSEGILNKNANNTKFGYKNWSTTDYEANRGAVNSSTYSTGNDKLGILTSGISEITAALGSFQLKFALNGTLSYVPPGNIAGFNIGNGKYIVKPDSIVIYLWDLFDFEGDQPLGHWNEDNNDVALFGHKDYVEVTNQSFRDWRNVHNMGGDYYIYTQPVTVKLQGSHAAEFDITAYV